MTLTESGRVAGLLSAMSSMGKVNVAVVVLAEEAVRKSRLCLLSD
jgi:hypothetical protein